MEWIEANLQKENWETYYVHMNDPKKSTTAKQLVMIFSNI